MQNSASAKKHRFQTIGSLLGFLLLSLIVAFIMYLSDTVARVTQDNRGQAAGITDTIQAAADGTLPWSANGPQETTAGPTAAWTNVNQHFLNICNGKWCWTRSLADSKWLNDGGPVDLSQAIQPTPNAISSTFPWSSGGPHAAWEEYANKYTSISVGHYLWLGSANDPYWSFSKDGVDLSTAQYWRDTVSVNSPMLFTGRGITTAWTDKANAREYFCNTKWCWVFNYTELRWHNQDSSGKGRPFDVTSLFKIAPAADGTTLTSANGPHVGWTDDLNNRSIVCTNGWCWSYVNRSGARPDLLDVTWDRPNGQGLGQAISICEALGQALNRCSNLQPTPVVGDFTGDSLVNMTDYNLFVSHLGTTNVQYNLTGTNEIDLYDFNELLKKLR